MRDLADPISLKQTIYVECPPATGRVWDEDNHGTYWIAELSSKMSMILNMDVGMIVEGNIKRVRGMCTPTHFIKRCALKPVAKLCDKDNFVKGVFFNSTAKAKGILNKAKLKWEEA